MLIYSVNNILSLIHRTLLFILLSTLSFLAKGQTVTVDNLSLTATTGLTLTIIGDLKNQNNGLIDNSGTITITGNWTNNSVNNVFSSNSGIVEFSGTSEQAIGGTNITSFYDLSLNNTSASATRYILGNSQIVKNKLTIYSGEVNLATHSLTIGTSGISAGTLNHISGWLYGGTLTRWIGTSTIATGGQEGLFPIGSSTDYRPFYISTPTTGPDSGGTISISHTDIPGNTPASFTDINITIDRLYNPYWTVSTGNGLSGGTYELRVDGTGFSGITDYKFLRLVSAGYSVGTNGANAGSNSNPQVIRTGLSMADLTNPFHFGYASAALPIELISFHAKQDQSAVNLNWVTATEINSDYFTVERSSDGKTFETVEMVPAAGNTSNHTYYSAVDYSPLPGLSYYRLRETDLDGSTVFSQPVSVHFKEDLPELEIIAVRTSGENAIITIHSPYQENFELDLYNNNGQVVFKKAGQLEEGNQDISVPFENNSKGIYIINLKTANRSVSKKVV